MVLLSPRMRSTSILVDCIDSNWTKSRSTVSIKDCLCAIGGRSLCIPPMCMLVSPRKVCIMVFDPIDCVSYMCYTDLDPKFDKLFTGLFNRFTHQQYYDLFPDVTPTLEFLKKNGFHTGVISNTDERIST